MGNEVGKVLKNNKTEFKEHKTRGLDSWKGLIQD